MDMSSDLVPRKLCTGVCGCIAFSWDGRRNMKNGKAKPTSTNDDDDDID